MAIAYTTAATGATWGATQGSVSGIILESHSQSYENPKEMLMNSSGTPVGFAINIAEKHTVTLSGEITGTIGTTGVLGGGFATAVTFANIANVGGTSVAGWCTGTGDFYIDAPSIESSRSSWKKFSCNFERWPAITGNAT